MFRSLDVPVRTLECCSGDLADLKVKSIDVEAWSPRQKNILRLVPAQIFRMHRQEDLKSELREENGNYLAHTLNNTVVAPRECLSHSLKIIFRRMARFLSPEPLRMYMGGVDKIVPSK